MNETITYEENGTRDTSGEEQSLPAGFLMRLAALLIDTFLLFSINVALLAIPSFLAWHYTIITELPAGAMAGLLFIGFALLSPLLLSFFYYTVLHAFGGQTLGKIFLGIRVVTPEQGSITVGTAFLRWCAHFLSILSFGTGYLWALIDNQKATLHDRIAATRVVQI